MSHTARINETESALFVVMIDQSGSMSEPYAPDGARTKAEVVAEVCNRTLSELVARCRDGNRWRHYFDVSVVGYSGLGVYSLLPEGAWLLSPAQLVASAVAKKTIQNTCKSATGASITIHSSYKVWVKAHAEGKTPMYAAFERLTEILFSWRATRRSLDGFPPTIINITDGEPTDATHEQLRLLVDRLERYGTTDGEPIIFNVHISSNNSASVLFPTSHDELPDEGHLLFHLSSLVPESYRAEMGDTHPARHSPDMRAMAYNASLDDLVRVMNIGSSTIKGRQ